MSYYLSQIIQGIASGCVYGLLGLAIMFIYRSTRVINFAQGEMATVTAYLAFSLLNFLPMWAAFLISLTCSFLFGVAIEAGILKLVRNRSELNTVIVTIGLYAIINGLTGYIYYYDPFPFPSPVVFGNIEIYGVAISYQTLWLLTCTSVLSLILFVFFKYTLTGIAFRAISEDQLAARLKGVRVGPMISICWGFSSLIGGIAGLLVAPTSFLHPNMMEAPLLYAIAAAKVGGLQSSFGALVGGILIGVTENLVGSTKIFGSDLKILPVYLILIFFLMIRPRGLFGRVEPRKI